MVDIEDLNIDELEQLRDACNRRILEMRQTRGLALADLLRLLDEVKLILSDQGKEWHSLERWQWMEGQVRFWLNPTNHELYRTGWFSIDELIAWSRDNGPIVLELEEEPEEESTSWPTYGIQMAWHPVQPGSASRPTADDALVEIS